MSWPKEFPVSVSSALTANSSKRPLLSRMSAKALNLLAEQSECSTEISSAQTTPCAPSPAQESGESLGPSPPPGLENLAPQTGQLGKASVSEGVEDACLSSSGSTRFEEEGDAEQAAFYSQDWELSAWGQSFSYPAYPMYETAPPAAPPSEAAILSTTPLCQPAATPFAPLPPPPAWEWPVVHQEIVGLAPPPEPAFYTSYVGPVQPGAEMQSMATLGSVGHEVGNCKPCAFVYTKGCQSGAPLSQYSCFSCRCFSMLIM